MKKNLVILIMAIVLMAAASCGAASGRHGLMVEYEVFNVTEGEAEREVSLPLPDPISTIFLPDQNVGSRLGGCYGKCKTNADCCYNETRCLEYKWEPVRHCVWCPPEGDRCGSFDPCCPGFDCFKVHAWDIIGVAGKCGKPKSLNLPVIAYRGA